MLKINKMDLFIVVDRLKRVLIARPNALVECRQAIFDAEWFHFVSISHYISTETFCIGKNPSTNNHTQTKNSTAQNQLLSTLTQWYQFLYCRLKFNKTTYLKNTQRESERRFGISNQTHKML